MAVYPKMEGQKSTEDLAAEVQQQRSKSNISNPVLFLKEQVAEIFQPISFHSKCTHPACNTAVHHKLPGYSEMKFMFPNFSLSCAQVFKYLYSEFALIHKHSSPEPLQCFSSPLAQ